ncbi:MAG: cytochrome-c oxidase, cbb3-type subunit II [Pseudomonadota bacterium]
MKHEVIEKNIGLMVILILIAISFGGLVEIVPLFAQKETTQPVTGLKPLNALELEGRDIYIREGCHVCHTQMIRPFRAETERYGHYSVAGESVYDHPFLWGSKRTGPDLARVGGRYSDEWHAAHLYNPRDVVPESIMPSYPWLAENIINSKKTASKMRALRAVGVPYTDKDIAEAETAAADRLEMEAVIAYLQQLGTVLNKK